jgi:DNA-binding transcriptional LysR family regulator
LVLRSRLLRDIVATIAAEHPDIEVLDDVVEMHAVSGLLRAGEAAVLICAGAEGLSVADLLYDHPRLRVLVVEEGGRTSFLWELFPLKRPLGELGVDCLLGAIRGD